MRSFIILILFPTLLSSAQINTDSLRTIWNNTNESDSTRIIALNKLIWEKYLFNQPDSAFILSQEIFELASYKGFQKEMATALNLQGISYSVRGEYDKALEYYNQSLEIKHKLSDDTEIAKTLNNIALIYTSQGKYAEAIEVHNKCLTISEENNHSEGIARSLLNIATLYIRIKDYDKALDYNNRSLSLYQGLNKQKTIAKCYNNNGIIFLKKGENDVALKYYLKALAIEEENRNEFGISLALGNIGIIYKLKGEFKSALNYYQRSLAIRKRIGDREGIANILSNIGDVYQCTGKNDKAIIYCNRALKIAQDVGTMDDISQSAECLYRAFREQKRYYNALTMLELHNEIEDSLQSERNQKEIIHQEFKYEYAQKHYTDSIQNARTIEIEKLKRIEQEFSTKIIQYVSYVIFVLILLVIGIILRFRVIKNKAQKEFLLRENQILKSFAVIQMTSSNGNILSKHLLDKKKIDKALNGALNNSDWNILSLLCENPTINNREISERVSLSIEGVRSSLKKMYRVLNIQNTNENQRMALVIHALRISEKL